MATEASRYLQKARESLASAQGHVEGGRYNSAANRAYYACFQAAVAALIHWRVRSPDSDWAHRFVSEELALRLIRRAKVISAEYGDVLNRLFALRIIADYGADDAPVRKVRGAVGVAERLLTEIASKMEVTEGGEARPEYETGMKTKQRDPDVCVAQIKDAILGDFPDVEIKTKQRGPRDFTLDVVGVDDERWEEFDEIYSLVTDILVDDDVWIVVLPLPRRDPAD